MKTFRIFGMALMAVLMCVNFVSCSNEEVTSEDLNQDKYITVGLDCVGEYLEITDSPLSRATGDDTYFIQVYSNNVPYAYGTFGKSLDGITIKLVKGNEYCFKVAIAVAHGTGNDTQFTYSDTRKYDFIGGLSPIPVTSEGFFGQLENFIPEEGKNAVIDTKRVSYAAKFIAVDLNEGTLDVDVKTYNGAAYATIYSVSLTPEFHTSDKIYSFWKTYEAWRGTITGSDSETGEYIYEDYTNEKRLTINWKKSEDDIISLGTYNVTFKRNVRTTIRIKVENPTYNNGITITREDTAISDDENEYNIEGGKITEIPVNSES